jgi:NADH dehydrogenase
MPGDLDQRGEPPIGSADQRGDRAHPLAHLVRGCAAGPLVQDLGLPTKHGRLIVDEYLGVPGHPELFASGDAAAVPGLTALARSPR